MPLSGLKIVSTCDSVTRSILSHEEIKFTPERDIKIINLHDKLSYCKLIEFADDIVEIQIKIRKTRE